MNLLRATFSAYAQVGVGVLLFVATFVQVAYWEWIAPPPSNQAIFIVSMEALGFAAYAIMATGFAVIWLDKRTPDA